MKELQKIQSTLNAPKNLYNKFGKYHYRSAESILEALKPILNDVNCVLTLSDEVRELNNGQIYIEAIAVFSNGDASQDVVVRSQAGIDINKKGMDFSQAYGAASSYARKYALNGMFLIDDTKDADATNDHGKGKPTTQAKELPWLNKDTPDFDKVKAVIDSGKATIEQARLKYKISKEVQELLTPKK